MSFTTDDVKFMDDFGAFLHKHAKFRFTMGQLLDFHKMLVRYNTLRNKVHDNIFEINKMIENPKPEEKKAKK